MSHRVFISHSWKYSDKYCRAVKFLNDDPNFQWTNSSVPEDRAFYGMTNAQLKEQITKQISYAQCVVILAGMYTNHSDWIGYEIDEALRMKKPIVAIIPWGAERTPLRVTLAANEVVGWNSKSITSAIRNLVVQRKFV
ncbi:TIR domain-containing protein [Acinetobacter pseudolwoffii]|uniref:TIR domain-containing protein n=1 Tax=Acinetobacter pseudolwoffii TaxID=2053287 RepID=UPI003524A86C